ncbi:MAG: undecaprenyl-diphosphate phosphatase [Planctomycetaceae bacterium]
MKRILFLTALLCFPVGTVAADEHVASNDAASAPSDNSPPPKLTVFQAIILGLVEGATEYLPVSSTGHLLIAEHLLGMDGDERQKAAAESLAICIQSGAILAVLLLYASRIRQVVMGMLGKDPDGLRLLINLMVAFFPAAVIGLLFNKWIKQHFFSLTSVCLALLTGGLIILAQSLRRKPADPQAGRELTAMTPIEALIVGLFQCVAFWPGFSRSLSTILGCQLAGLRMMAAVEFSFLLGLVTLSAATSYEGLKHGAEMISSYGVATPAIALVTAFAAAIVSVRFMVTSLSRFGLTPFGYYRILLAAVCYLWLAA